MSSMFPLRKLALDSAEFCLPACLPPLIHAWTLHGGVEEKKKKKTERKGVKRELDLNIRANYYRIRKQHALRPMETI